MTCKNANFRTNPLTTTNKTSYFNNREFNWGREAFIGTTYTLQHSGCFFLHIPQLWSMGSVNRGSYGTAPWRAKCLAQFINSGSLAVLCTLPINKPHTNLIIGATTFPSRPNVIAPIITKVIAPIKAGRVS